MMGSQDDHLVKLLSYRICISYLTVRSAICKLDQNVKNKQLWQLYTYNRLSPRIIEYIYCTTDALSVASMPSVIPYLDLVVDLRLLPVDPVEQRAVHLPRVRQRALLLLPGRLRHLAHELLQGRSLRVGQGEVLADRRHQGVLGFGLE